MNIKEVPQDDEANLFEGKLTEVQYAINEDGQYTKVNSSGWEAKTIANQDAWDQENEKIKKALDLVIAGKKSPLYYYMYKCLMDVGILAKYTGFTRFKVKRHFKPVVFQKLSDEVLEKYLYAFDLKSKTDLLNFHPNED